ncbi:hypothetical protein EYD45_07320 [Hyunsoonleella flava]|uniref:Uncharacterized protein n=1 Tax=Hyunsoonleella flava TaxID=2527939 RepID=A0A4Q9FK42_9FLAO|nr:hypothetical protein [Hyunsoonleella flava]TBN04419.1 hypothetical protein EYD45_07320 [Hyunsoonleella flava]
MSKEIKKGFKSFIVKAVTIAMCFCYVFGPLHSEISEVLHKIAHQLEMPEHVISHSDTFFTNNAQAHSEHSLETSANIHNHYVLNIIDNLFKASESENDSENTDVLIIKLDKHTRYKQKYKRSLSFVLNTQSKMTFFLTGQIRLGYLKSPIQPPQYI